MASATGAAPVGSKPMDLRGKTAVTIGGAGLIGSHTVDQLLATDIGKIVIFDNFTRGTEANLREALKDPRVEIFESGGDIRDVDILKAALSGADCVFHFAALWLLHCHEFPRSAFEVNIKGMFNVLEACVEARVSRLVFSSSASVYGDAIEEPMTEDHPHNNRNFYGATKIAGEAMARSYHYRYGLNFVGLRYMNVYGPRQDYHGAYIAVMMKMLDAIERGERPRIIGTGDEAFDFVSVEDCAAANICAMRADVVDKFYNVGTGKRTSLRELAELLCELSGVRPDIEYVPADNPTLVRNRIGATERASAEIGFDASVKLREGLEKLVAWRQASKSAAVAG